MPTQLALTVPEKLAPPVIIIMPEVAVPEVVVVETVCANTTFKIVPADKVFADNKLTDILPQVIVETLRFVIVAAGADRVPLKNKFVPTVPPAEKFNMVPTLSVAAYALVVMLPKVDVKVVAERLPADKKLRDILPQVIVEAVKFVTVAAGEVRVPLRNKFVPTVPPAVKFNIVPTLSVAA